MAGKTRTVLELRVGSLAEGDLRVSRVRGREALSEPFLFEVEFESRGDEPLELADLIGAEARLAVRRADGPERLLHGVAEAVELAAVRVKRPRYRLRLVPRLALLAHGADSRIFQGLTVPEIVKKLLDEGKVAHAFGEKRQASPGGLSAAYPKREVCVQYRESDLAFVSRLLEEEGIFYLFDHADGGSTLVLADDPGAFQPIAGDDAVPFGEPEAARESDLEHVHGNAREGRLLTAKATLRDFDFERPDLKLEEPARPPKDGELEDYGFGLGYGDPAPLKRLSRVRLEELRDAADTVEGRSNCLRLVPGQSFEVAAAPSDRLGGKLQLLWVGCEAAWEEGADSAHYHCAFAAQPAGTPFRPPRRTPRPVVAGTQTATVVGPGGEEIHVDKHGRVKLHFHWDRLGKRDDKASAFVRVAQPWAGPGWGSVRLPRLGQEALVRFLDGDPDRPLVVGTVYNGANPPPVPLPDDKSRSTLRSDSSLGGGGYHELAFEDREGEEEVLLHVQRDEELVVENDKRQEVHGHEALAVDKDRQRSVGQDQRLAIGGDEGTGVGGDQSLTVTGLRATQTGLGHEEAVAGTQSITVAGTATVEVAQASAVTVGAAAALSVGGAYAVTAGGALNVTVGGARLEQVGGARLTAVGAAAALEVRKKAEAAVGGDDASSVEGGVAQTTGKDVEEKLGGKASIVVAGPAGLVSRKLQLEAQQGLRVVVGGQVMLEMKSSGAVTLAGKAISLDGDQITTKGSKVAKTAGAGPASAPGSAAKKDEKEKPGKAEASWSATKAEPNADVTLDVKLTDVPDSKKGQITIHHAVTGALVPGGKIECESKGGKLVDKKTGKAPVFQFGAKQLPWDPWDKPFFFYKASVEYQGLHVETPADAKDGGKSLKVKTFHVCLGDSWADAGGLTTGAEASEIAGILGGVPDSKAVTRMMSVPSPTFADWAPHLKGTYCYHHGSHGTCQDRVNPGVFIDVDPPPAGFGDPPACPVGNWRSVVILSKRARYQYLALGDTEVRDKAKFPEVPRYLAYLDCCLAGWEPSLGRAFVARGTQYVIAFRRTIPDGDAREMARKFHKKWARTHKLDPGAIRDLFFEVGAPFYRTMRPVLVSWRYEPMQAPDAGVVERALAAVGAVVEGVVTAIGSLFK